mmetsp:Transcript_51015/g.101485  ORF Transcript_51015/g.101485 Transcript_51015/m.101485 type:complete len:464 (-) Transcript_51015:416-1807(-)
MDAHLRQAPAAAAVAPPETAAHEEAAAEPDAPAPARTPFIFSTTFGFCFGMGEGMLMLAGLQLLGAAFWLYSLSLQPSLTWPDSNQLRVSNILLLILNATLGMTAVRWSSESLALALVLSFGVLISMLAVDLSRGHPSSCSRGTVVDNSDLGELVTHLLWTSDACLLMTILGWVTIAAGTSLAAYMWYMTVCFWAVLRARSEDMRRVYRAIAALPCRKYSAAEMAAEEELGRGADEGGDTCAICLSEFEVGEDVRLLPCMHEFCRECIDVWIQRQGLSASCPLCKRMLVPTTPGRNSTRAAAQGVPPAEAMHETDRSAAMLEPLIAPGNLAQEPLLAPRNSAVATAVVTAAAAAEVPMVAAAAAVVAEVDTAAGAAASGLPERRAEVEQVQRQRLEGEGTSQAATRKRVRRGAEEAHSLDPSSNLPSSLPPSLPDPARLPLEEQANSRRPAACVDDEDDDMLG